MNQLRSILRWIGWPTVHVDVHLWLIAVRLIVLSEDNYADDRIWVTVTVGRRATGFGGSARWFDLHVASRRPELHCRPSDLLRGLYCTLRLHRWEFSTLKAKP